MSEGDDENKEINRSHNKHVFGKLEDAEEAIRCFEVNTFASFSIYQKDKTFGDSTVDIKKHKILFEDVKTKELQQQISFTGVPFVILGKKSLDCTHGVDHGISKKKKRADEKSIKKNSHNAADITKVYSKSRFLSQDSKKIGCTAKVIIRDIIFFPDYQATGNTENKKRTASQKLRAAWNNDPSTVKYERKYYVRFPTDDSHSNHIRGENAGISQQVDDRIITKIHQLVGEGVKDVREMQRHIQVFVRNELFRGKPVPSSTSRRFHPKKKDIRNHIYIASTKLRLSKLDQENLYLKIKQWKNQYPNDSIFFRGYGSVTADYDDRQSIETTSDTEEEVKVKSLSTKQRLLFVHQNEKQKRLLQRYGNEICLLDATYRTTKYSIPLFFLATKTNVDYQVVGSFAVQDETTEAISEAISILKSWNVKTWKPKSFMVDNCEEEIAALEYNFPECKVLLCDFHREQAWERWLNLTANGARVYKGIILAYLRRIANSETEETYLKNVTELQDSDVWSLDQSKKLRDWISKTWLPCHERWVRCYRAGLLDVAVNTNNGVERKNRDFKYEYLKQYKDKSLSGMLTVLLEQFLPDLYNRYLEENIRRSGIYRRYNKSLPSWLHDKPKKFTKHCIDRLSSAENMNRKHIVKSFVNEKDVFMVSSASTGEKYVIDLGDETKFPSCTCIDWRKTLFPCKHILAVITKIEGMSWSSLSKRYRESPFLMLDHDLINCHQNDDVPADFDMNADVNEEQYDDVPSMTYSKLTKQSFPKRSKATVCRELMRQLNHLSHLIYDNDALDHMEETLTQLLKTMEHHSPKDDQLILERPSVVRNAPSKKKFDNLPKPKQTKTGLAGRCGISTEKRKASKLVEVEEKKVKKEILVEEYPAINPNDVYDIPMEQQPCIPNLPDQAPAIEENLPNSPTNGSTLNDDIIITNEVGPSDRTDVQKRRKLIFSKEERETILNKHMLTDESINIAQNLIKSQFPNIMGLQDTVIGKTQSFDVIAGRDNFIQILHAGSLHWVTVANMDPAKCERDECSMFDSLSKGKVSTDVAKQIAAFSFCEMPELLVNIMPVQQQKNAVDCGVFAIAFATSLAYGDDPRNITYDTTKMRSHLVACLENGHISQFPQSTKRAIKCKELMNVIEIYCTCRMPYDIRGENMIECCQCYQWYHMSCQNVSKNINIERNWYCKACKSIKKKK